MRPSHRLTRDDVPAMPLVLLWGILITLIMGRLVWAQLVSPPGQSNAQQKTLGAVRLQLLPDQVQMGLADTLKLTLTVEAPPEITLTLPEVSKTLGPFTVTSHRTAGPMSLSPQLQRWQREYALTVTSAGDLTIPALTVEVQDGASRQSLQTDPLTIVVSTLLPANADPSAPKDIAPPVSVARQGLSPGVWLVAAGLLALLLGAGGWWYWRRRPARRTPLLQRPAHLLALAALEQLQRQELIEQARIEAFYVRLSTIARRYIELRFGLRAPEQTTEEFLNAVLRTDGLLVAHRDLLRTFLQHCDLVKFARHQPTPHDMEEAFESAKVFIEQTADAQVLITVPASGEVPL